MVGLRATEEVVPVLTKYKLVGKAVAKEEATGSDHTAGYRVEPQVVGLLAHSLG